MGKEKKETRPKIAFIAAFLLFIALACALFAFNLYAKYEKFKKTAVSVSNPTILTIEKGVSWQNVAKKLKNSALISDEKKFIWLIKEKKWDKNLKTGEFEFSGEITPVEIVEKIMSGKVKLRSFTVPEGYNKYETAELFKKLDWIEGNQNFLEICHDNNFLASIDAKGKKSCEGLLFPSTYAFPRGADIIAVMGKMAAQMKDVLKKYENELLKIDIDLYDFIKLASIIEKESGMKSEQPKIASVFLNRIKIGMKMQTDPSVIYGLLPKFNGNIRRKDLLTDHPWNTYTRFGFPATPICFPGEGAIKSALFPDKTKYLYFVATGKGGHYFSKTLKEHNAAVEHYQLKGKSGKLPRETKNR